MIDRDGVVSDFVRLAYFTYRKNSYRQMERDWKVSATPSPLSPLSLTPLTRFVLVNCLGHTSFSAPPFLSLFISLPLCPQVILTECYIQLLYIFLTER